MTDPVTLHAGYYKIDTAAWLRRRTGDQDAEHSALLQDFVRCAVFDTTYGAWIDPGARMRLWCAARGWQESATGGICHDDQYLTEPATIVLATNGDDRAVALSLQRAAEQHLVRERAVDLGGVEEGHAELERPMDGGDGLAVVEAAVGLAHPHATEPERGDGETFGAQDACLHGRTIGAGDRE